MSEEIAEYRVDLTAIASFEDYIAAFNAGLIHHVGGHWNGNLDAFNDYLYWPERLPYRLVLIGWTHAAGVLAKIPRPDGRTMLADVEEIFVDNTQVVVIYK
ncbi:MAG: hypothetical protein NTW19_06675 [Planctomycetota bacterium]|nr:hypothetical protein [Planctomycetota bacterium]